MSTIKPFLDRRPQKPWLGFFLGGLTGAVVTALLAALVAGMLFGGSLLAHVQPAKLLAATGATLAAALMGGVVVGAALWWALPRYRLTPWRSLGVFMVPVALAGLGAVIGVPGNLKTYASFLLPLFAFQAAITWGLFAWLAYPAYSQGPKKKKKPQALLEASVEPDGSEP